MELLRLPGRIYNKLVAPVALGIKQRGEIAMIDPRVGGGGDPRLGMKGNAETRCFEHREVVGAIADGESLLDSEAMLFAQLFESRELGIFAEDRLRDEPAQPAVLVEKQLVRPMVVEADRCRDNGGEDRESSR